MSLATPSVANVKFEFNTATCDCNSFYDLDINILYDGENKPNFLFGETATIDGTVEALGNFSNSNVTFKACV